MSDHHDPVSESPLRRKFREKSGITRIACEDTRTDLARASHCNAEPCTKELAIADTLPKPQYSRIADISPGMPMTYQCFMDMIISPRCRMKGPIFVAQRVVVTLSDDIDGSEAAETVAFGLDGKSYEIDLNQANAKKLRKALAPVRGGRPQAVRGPARRTSRPHVAPDPAAVRAWAQAHKMDVPARGRIPKKVYEAFAAAH